MPDRPSRDVLDIDNIKTTAETVRTDRSPRGTRERVMEFKIHIQRKGESVNRNDALGFHSQQPIVTCRDLTLQRGDES
jgi:hypothetical protein